MLQRIGFAWTQNKHNFIHNFTQVPQLRHSGSSRHQQKTFSAQPASHQEQSPNEQSTGLFSMLFNSISSTAKLIFRKGRENTSLLSTAFAWLIVASLALEVRSSRRNVEANMKIYYAKKSSLEKDIEELKQARVAATTSKPALSKSVGSTTSASNSTFTTTNAAKAGADIPSESNDDFL